MLRLVNRDQQNLGEEHRDGSTQTLVAGDASSKVDGTSSVIVPALITSTIQVLWRWTTHKEPGGSRLSLTPPFSARLLSQSLNVPQETSASGLRKIAENDPVMVDISTFTTTKIPTNDRAGVESSIDAGSSLYGYLQTW